MKTNPNSSVVADKADEAFIAEVVRAARGLRFGQIVLTIHNSKVVQIDRTEKIRLDAFVQYDKGSGI
jgi:hypothetical protein